MDNNKKLEDIFNSIKIGRANAINPPPELEYEFKEYVDSKNSKGDVVINVGNGYYRPYPRDNKDNKEFEKYITSEYDRVNTIIEKCTKMTMVYEILTEKINEKWKETEKCQGNEQT